MIITAVMQPADQAPPPQPPDASAEHSHGMFRCLAAIAPAIREARTRLRDGAIALARSHAAAPFDPSAMLEAFSAPLGGQLLGMMSRTLVLELNVARLEGRLTGSTGEERFESFISGFTDPDRAARFFGEYPVLRRQLELKIEKWSTFCLEFLTHLCQDWEIVMSLAGGDPGELAAVQMGAGDTHRNGRSVIIATFATGRRAVYKPRSLAVDEHFQQLLTLLNMLGAEPRFRILKAVDRGNHGWSEFVEAASCETEQGLAAFYKRQGAYLAVLYALNATDFHCENLIAAGEHPMLIDMEALFHPRLEVAVAAADGAVAGILESVQRTGLLPVRLWGGADHAGIDMSGLSNPAGQLSPRGAPDWEGVNTDEMRVVRRQLPMKGALNCPKLHGKEVNAFEHAEAVVEGFTFMYRLLLRHRSRLGVAFEGFGSDEVRYIARGTRTYGILLQESFHPDVLRQESARQELFERLRDGGAHQRVVNRLMGAECRDLAGGDVPLFTARPASRHVWTSAGECIEDFFDEPPIASARRRLAVLSEQDLQRQSWMVRASLATLSSTWAGTPGLLSLSSGNRLPEPEELMRAACRAGDRLEEMALSSGGKTNWLGLSSISEHQRQVSPLGPDLYDGLPGTILFLTYLGKVSGNRRYTDLANSALATLRSQIEGCRPGWGSIGAFSGWSGILYTLCHLSVVLHDAELLKLAAETLEPIAKLTAEDRMFDVIGGAAGCGLALRSLAALRPSPAIARAAAACGDHLLSNAIPAGKGIGWLCVGSSDWPLAGFAHGNAGIACSLAEIAAMTGEPRFAQASRAATEYERGLFSPEYSAWPDLRRKFKGAFATAWCHGAPGIGLARLIAMRHGSDPEMAAEIQAALKTTATRCFGQNHIVCHGDLGNADILLYASKVLGEPRWQTEARRYVGRLLTAARQQGWIFDSPLNTETPGFMTGLAGIGYTLLRFADPDSVPCVLALDAPEVPR